LKNISQSHEIMRNHLKINFKRKKKIGMRCISHFINISHWI